MGLMQIVIAVPARLESTRLPGKVMKDICGKPMLRRVFDQCLKAKSVNSIFLCTDSPLLIKSANDWGINAILTSKDCKSGSERISSVIPKLIGNTSPEKSLIINVQGDQPFIDETVIDLMVEEFEKRISTPKVMTPVYELSKENIHNPNVVKVLLTNDKRAIYFSRSAIPHVRDVSPENWHSYSKYWGHVGIYGYRGDVLAKWLDFPYSELEKNEKLEQLKLIDAGIQIDTFVVNKESLSVDTLDQLNDAREIAESMKLNL